MTNDPASVTSVPLLIKFVTALRLLFGPDVAVIALQRLDPSRGILRPLLVVLFILLFIAFMFDSVRQSRSQFGWPATLVLTAAGIAVGLVDAFA